MIVQSVLLVPILVVCTVAVTRLVPVGSWAFLPLLLVANATIVIFLRLALGKLETDK